jgi:hypothetical protein
MPYRLQLNAFLLSFGAQIGETALMLAASNGHLAVVQWLQQAGADMHARYKVSCMLLCSCWWRWENDRLQSKRVAAAMKRIWVDNPRVDRQVNNSKMIVRPCGFTKLKWMNGLFEKELKQRWTENVGMSKTMNEKQRTTKKLSEFRRQGAKGNTVDAGPSFGRVTDFLLQLALSRLLSFRVALQDGHVPARPICT